MDFTIKDKLYILQQTKKPQDFWANSSQVIISSMDADLPAPITGTIIHKVCSDHYAYIQTHRPDHGVKINRVRRQIGSMWNLYMLRVPFTPLQ